MGRRGRDSQMCRETEWHRETQGCGTGGPTGEEPTAFSGDSSYMPCKGLRSYADSPSPPELSTRAIRVHMAYREKVKGWHQG